MDLIPPAAVASVAAKALEMRSEQPPSNQGGTAVGVKRANQLANRENLSPSTIKRMVSFFARHEVDKQAEGFRKGEKGFPSKGRQAWDLWGGDPGRTWAEEMLRKLDAETSSKQENTMIDVNVLTGADIRRIDGKYGKISKVSLPWVTVEWANGAKESFSRSDAALTEDIELKTLDKGWIPLGSVVGINESATVDATPAIDESVKSTRDLLIETRLLKRRLMMSEAAKKRKSKASEKVKAKLKAAKATKKKGKGGGGGPGKKMHSPYKRLSGRGQPPEAAPGYTGYTDNFFGKAGLTQMPKKNVWDCKKVAPYHQRCTNVETGEVKDVYVKKSYKKSYNAGYAAATRDGATNAANAKG